MIRKSTDHKFVRYTRKANLARTRSRRMSEAVQTKTTVHNFIIPVLAHRRWEAQTFWLRDRWSVDARRCKPPSLSKSTEIRRWNIKKSNGENNTTFIPDHFHRHWEYNCNNGFQGTNTIYSFYIDFCYCEQKNWKKKWFWGTKYLYLFEDPGSGIRDGIFFLMAMRRMLLIPM